MRFIILITLITLSTICSCKKKTEVIYFDDGKIKLTVEINKEGKWNGIAHEYFKDGNLRSTGHWNNGVLNGVVTFYYLNGNIEQIVNYKNGVKHGPYYIYDKKSFLVEEGIYQFDTLVYVVTFFEGKKFGSVLPIITAEKDTVFLDEKYNVKIKFGISLTGDLKAYIGNSLKGILQDTTDILYPLSNNEFSYSTYPKDTGINNFSVLIEHKHNKVDSLSADGVMVSHYFYVK